ncbi:TetR/AcrR family transcriptional regulator [Cryptosporangium arvum]|uniref:TetR/AcrR family transcriptional regulator n=1 Tax=Cryptosporangium arvum TaxID=80871 RepID=UPI0004B3D9AF|nr:TetR/AcrR family transcriptional regulator [Cryptosporangium arvum]
MTAPGRLQAEKRDAITRAARIVFGRDGYARAAVDAIATEAGVSTRTLYKHFASKDVLFTSVLEASATQVADGFLARLRDVPGAERADDVPRELRAVGHALVRQAIDHPEHFAMVRQIVAESTHFPEPVITLWQEAGPRRVEREVARRLVALDERGLLAVPSVDRAVMHFMALTTIEASPRPLKPAGYLGAEGTEEAVSAAVQVFLTGYQQ